MQKRKKRIFWGNDLEYQAALIVRGELEEYQKILDELQRDESSLKLTKSLIDDYYRCPGCYHNWYNLDNLKIYEHKETVLISSLKKRLRDFRKRKISLHRLYLESLKNVKNAKT